MEQQFPFGQVVKKVEQSPKTQKEYFILGVYASAVHAKWISKDGKLKVRALAVASEPEIFWRGAKEEGEKIISQIIIPTELGKLELADKQFNGPSGKVLDESYLKPLNLTRNEVWLSDLMPFAALNTGQKNAIKREYEPEVDKYKLPKVTIKEVPTKFCDDSRIAEIIQELKESNAKKIILLGDIPIKEFLNKFDSKYRKLSDFEVYGQWHKIKIEETIYDVLPLIHPRQAGKLGIHSKEWCEKHELWVNNLTKK